MTTSPITIALWGMDLDPWGMYPDASVLGSRIEAELARMGYVVVKVEPDDE